MDLKPCKECGAQVSSSAKQCPHCGKKWPTGGLTPGVKIALGLFVLFALGQVLYGRQGIRSGTSTTATTAPAGLNSAFSTTAGKLFADYQANEVSADTLYKGRSFTVVGEVDAIKKDFQDRTYLTLKTANRFMPVHARVRESAVSRAAALSPNQEVEVVCRGGGMVMGSPMMDDCIIR